MCDPLIFHFSPSGEPFVCQGPLGTGLYQCLPFPRMAVNGLTTIVNQTPQFASKRLVSLPGLHCSLIHRSSHTKRPSICLLVSLHTKHSIDPQRVLWSRKHPFELLCGGVVLISLHFWAVTLYPQHYVWRSIHFNSSQHSFPAFS